jgi:2,3-bisphosphoglycerate-independent phosphoglycerate mutase
MAKEHAAHLRPGVLVIFDGWGIAPEGPGNAISQASTPNFEKLVTTYPTFALSASSEYVGLPWGEVGNSEVGHINIGAGQIIYQDLPRIDRSIKDQSFFTNEVLVGAVKRAQQNKKRVHLLGMFSAGNVHASDQHMIALLDLCKSNGVTDPAVHVILDGRDVERNTGAQYIKNLQAFMRSSGCGAIATMSGRYYAMDRDNHWERIEKAYRAMVFGDASRLGDDPLAMLEAAYAENMFDEEFVPAVVTRDGEPVGMVQPGDTVLFANFRSDRARQLTKAFVLPGLEKFDRGEYLRDVAFVTMTEYDRDLPVQIAFPPIAIPHPLAWAISDAGKKQLHIAETEKYAHVTFFINGGQEQPFPGEEHVLIPSAGIANYADKPSMSAYEITDRVVQELATGTYDFYVINYANVDMVGHTGKFAETVTSVEIVDECLGKLMEAALPQGGALFVTADHGNAEEKINVATGEHLKEHSTNPVPFIVAAEALAGRAILPDADLSILQPVGVLADVAPTILAIMDIPIPEEMTGTPLQQLP